MRLFHKAKVLFNAGKSLKKKVLVGSFWLYLLGFSSYGLMFIQTVILARLLAPRYFGVIGVYFILSAAFEGFTHTGFQKALIQREALDEDFLNTAWTISIVRGIILFALTFSLSPLVVGLLGIPEAMIVVRVLAISLLLQGCNNIGVIYFHRDFVFHKEFIWKIGGILANFVISVPLAFVLRNEWALVWGLLGSAFVNLMLSYSLHPYRPRLKFSFNIFSTLFGYGKWLLFSSILAYFARQGDKIVIAKLLGKEQLGIYIVALRFAKLPELFSKQIKNVLFPAYAKFQNNLAAMKNVYLKSLSIIALFCVPFVGGAIILARPFVSVFLGEKWLAAAVPLQILVIASLINIITVSGMSLSNALGKTSYSFKVNVVYLITLAVFLYPLITNYGIIGVALCFFIRALAGLVLWKIEMSNSLKMKMNNLSLFIFPILNTLFFMVIIYYLNLFYPIINLFNIFASILLVIIIYFTTGIIIHKFTKHKVFEDLFRIILEFK